MINRNRLIEFFKTCCKIPSQSGKEKEIIIFLKKVMEDMGFKTWEDNVSKETIGNANSLYAYLKGNPNKKALGFTAHADSVEHLESINIIQEENIIKTDGNSILGADNKAGIAITVEAIRSIIENNVDHGDIYVYFPVQEEWGMGAIYMNPEGFNPDLNYNFDEAVPCISFEVQGPDEYRISAKLELKKEKYSFENVLTIASRIVTKLEKYSFDPDVYLNVGLIRGGRGMYRFPETCDFEVMLRSKDHGKAEYISEQINEIFETEMKNTGVKIDYINRLVYKTFDLDQEDPMYKYTMDQCRKIGVEPIIRENFDCFDTSELNSKGVKTITVSTGYENFHQHTECLHIDQFVKSCEFAYNLILNAPEK